MPKQNRPLVRDGRLQAKKKRTDRSYLRPGPSQVAPVRDEPAVDIEEAAEAPAAEAIVPPMRETPRRAESRAAAPASPVAASPSRPAAGRLPTSVRAIQQQGVRKRREFDVQALAVRDTQYAMHELRRIAVLAMMVVVTLIVLGIVLR